MSSSLFKPDAGDFDSSAPTTTKGDIIVRNSTTNTRLPVGSDGQVLTADAAQALGVKWAAPGAGTYTAPTVQKFTATGATTGRLFTISTSTTCSVGDTYTNNGNTYTVLAALSAQSGQVLYMSGANAPQASGTLTRATGAGTASVTFTSSITLATYTTPANVLFIRVRMVGGGGGGGGGGTIASAPGAGGAGGTSVFGSALLVANGGSGGSGGRDPSSGSTSGGTASLGTGPVGLALQGSPGYAAGRGNSSAFNNPSGAGGRSVFGGEGGPATGNTAGGTAVTNSGSGGSGGGYDSASSACGGYGGGAGGYVDAIITSPASTYYYAVGTAGSNGSAGTSGGAGGSGAAGIIIVEEHYQ